MAITDTELMGRWFAKVTQPQLTRYNQRMSDAAPYRNSPRWNREREFAQRHFRYETCEARQLYERAMADLEVFGEVSEETDALLTQFQVAGIFAEAAE
jgi:hypothetical protein